MLTLIINAGLPSLPATQGMVPSPHEDGCWLPSHSIVPDPAEGLKDSRPPRPSPVVGALALVISHRESIFLGIDLQASAIMVTLQSACVTGEVVAALDKSKQTDSVTRRAALISVILTSFVMPFAASSVNVALPAIGREFGMDAITLSWVATAFLLTSAMFLVPFGRLGDMRGRKVIFVWGCVVFTVTSLLLSISPSGSMLLGLRVFQGIGGAMVFANGMALLISAYPPQERGRVLGINVAAVYVGLSVGPFVGGLLTHYISWRSIFLLNVPLGLVATAFAFWRLADDASEARGERFDFTGSVIYAITLVATMYGFSQLPAPLGFWLILVGLVGLALFIFWEQRTPSPVLDVRLFKDNATFAFSNLAALINYAATFAVSFLLSFYLQYIKGLSPQDAGIVLVAAPVVQAVFSPLAGRLSDKVEPRWVASTGMALTTFGLLLFTLVDASTSLAYIVATLIIIGFGFALFSSPNTNAVMSAVDRRFYGVASATIGTMRQLGQMLSMGIAMLVFATYIGHVEIRPENLHLLMASIKTAFVISVVLGAVGIYASLKRGNVQRPETLRDSEIPFGRPRP